MYFVLSQTGLLLIRPTEQQRHLLIVRSASSARKINANKFTQNQLCLSYMQNSS